MQPLVIRYNRKVASLMLAALAIALAVTAYYIYFSGKFGDSQLIKMVYAVLAAGLLYTIYKVAKNLITNKPAITLTKDEIHIHTGKPVSFLWAQVIDWQVVKDESTTYLIIQTAERTKKVNISWLEKKPAEIELVMEEYKYRKQRPHVKDA
ncbi:MAG TPA: hypothetical protein VD993_00655 [Chitinophagaceae bacterium]|nr:hypothetical protein [Chitinophagaceae bacterium]